MSHCAPWEYFLPVAFALSSDIVPLDSARTVESAGPLTSDVVVLASAERLPAAEVARLAVGASLQQLSSAIIKIASSPSWR